MADVFVREIPLPRAVEGCVTPNDDGTYSIYLNINLPEETRRKALEHELRHIKADHLYGILPLSDAEKQADGRVINIFNIEGMIPEFKSLEHLKHYAQQIEGRNTP